jgi:hypothetical protein
VGITNNSGVTQNFVTPAEGSGYSGVIQFRNSATAGNLTVFTNNGATADSANGGFTQFFDTSSAGSAIFENYGSSVAGSNGGLTAFYHDSSAGDAGLIAFDGMVSGARGGLISIEGRADGGRARVLGFRQRHPVHLPPYTVPYSDDRLARR